LASPASIKTDLPVGETIEVNRLTWSNVEHMHLQFTRWFGRTRAPPIDQVELPNDATCG
jgi:hypothetical protein